MYATSSAFASSEEPRRRSETSWEEHMSRIRSESMCDNLVKDNDEKEKEAVERAILNEAKVKKSREQELFRKKMVKESTARSKDFALQMLTIHEKPNTDIITLRLQAETCMKAIILLQRWIRGCLVRKLVKQIVQENERLAKIAEAKEIGTGGGWKEARDREGRAYFWNRISGCTTYSEPAIYENISGEVMERVGRRGATRRFSQYASQWGTAISKEGRRYYYDKVTGSRSWQPPPGWGTRGTISPAQERLRQAKTKNTELRQAIREMQEEVRRLQTGMLDLPTLESAVSSM
eukprot:g475.t1